MTETPKVIFTSSNGGQVEKRGSYIIVRDIEGYYSSELDRGEQETLREYFRNEQEPEATTSADKQREIENLIAILSAPYLMTDTSELVHARLKELMGL